jgi:hypothetical protein
MTYYDDVIINLVKACLHALRRSEILVVRRQLETIRSVGAKLFSGKQILKNCAPTER